MSEITLLTSSSSSDTTSMLVTFIPLVLIIVVFYFLLIRPQRKKDKEDTAMRNNIQVGDEIVTAGGIIGIVFSIKEDTLVVETGGDRSKIRIKKWAVSQNLTVHEQQEAARAAAKEARMNKSKSKKVKVETAESDIEKD
ncbi:MAG: preprotein translocase subunit YajC [Ruminococcus sp.]|nr:preprotein translocase subunit YajC [Ruminococcus sp.]